MLDAPPDVSGPPARPRSRGRLALVAAAVVAVVLVAGGVWWFTHRVPDAPAPPPDTTASSLDAVRDTAGLSDPARLRKTGSLTVNDDGKVVADREIRGVVNIRADGVRLSNVRIVSDTSSFAVNVANDVRGVVLEHVEIVMTKCANAGIHGGRDVVVRHSLITGCGDGIKAARGGTYEFNHIAVTKPDGSDKHLDGIQDSGDGDVVIRGNWIDVPAASGGNSAIILKPDNAPITNVVIEGNYLNGGNHTVIVEGRASTTGVRLVDNRFGRDFRYAPFLFRATVQQQGNVWADTKAAVEK